MNLMRRGRLKGFTLLEVLVALSIAAIGLAAVSRALYQNIEVADRLSQKMVGTWVASNYLAELQINREYLNRQIFHYALGPSRSFTPAIALAWLAPLSGLLILTLGLLTLWAWLSRRWSLPYRLLITIVFLASLITIFISLRWNLFTMLL